MMTRLLTLLLLTVTLAGCANTELYKFIPSFWDDNQSARIIDVRVRAARFDCAQPHLAQIAAIRDDLLWFQYYSQSKGYLQRDVLELIAPMQETVEDFHKRSAEREGSVAYCKIKVGILQKQSQKAAEAVLGRF